MTRDAATSERSVDLPQLRVHLDGLYERLNRRCYVNPDPLQFLHDYPDPEDREIAGVIASSLAFGNVRQILRSVAAVLERMHRPAHYLDCATRPQLMRVFAGFRHRYVDGTDLAHLLWGVKGVRECHGSLRKCFCLGLAPGDDTVLVALESFVASIRDAGAGPRNYLLPDPALGSACKRLHLFLRWMARSDDVDPGGWPDVPASRLLIPLDTHMHRLARALGMTRRNAGDRRTVLEVTAAFRVIRPDDPVRYDFALTRLGIREDTDACDFLRSCGRTVL